jgi:hypothetical protein
MPPKQHRQPEVNEDPASMPPAQNRQPAATGGPAHVDTTQQQPEWMAYLLDQIDTRVARAIASEVNPRLEALEDARSSRSASPSEHGIPQQQSYAQPSQAPQSYAQPSQAPQSYAQPSQAPQSYAPLSQAPQSYAPPSQTPQSYAPPSQAPSAGPFDFQQQRQPDGVYQDHRKPRFRPESLPQVWFGCDVAKWIVEMEHTVLQYGEEIVCPEIFAHSFLSGDAIKLWYMDLSLPHRKGMTSGPGCWQRFKEEMEHRFSVDVGLRQIEAEDRTRHPDELYADFALQKMYLIRRAFPNLAPSALIAMVKRKLDWEAVSFCRERASVDNFVTELMEYDQLKAMQVLQQPLPPATRTQRVPQSSQAVGNRAYGQPRRQPAQFQQQSFAQPVQQPYSMPAQQPYSMPTQQPYSVPVHQAAAPYRQQAGSSSATVDARLATVQLRKNPLTGVDTLSYLDRNGKSVFIQRPCGHCDAAGMKNAWHFEFSCASKTQAPRRARTYVGVAGLPGTVESPSGLPTSYTFNGHACDPEENPFSIDDCEESGNGEWDQ